VNTAPIKQATNVKCEGFICAFSFLCRTTRITDRRRKTGAGSQSSVQRARYDETETRGGGSCASACYPFLASSKSLSGRLAATLRQNLPQPLRINSRPE
jgi:hypothetical protein